MSFCDIRMKWASVSQCLCPFPFDFNLSCSSDDVAWGHISIRLESQGLCTYAKATGIDKVRHVSDVATSAFL